MAEGLITPDELKRITEDKEMEKAREALEKNCKMEGDRDHLREAFMAQEIHPDVFERVSRVVKSAAERGEREVLAVRFSSEYCTDRGRAINNFETNWPETLTGFAKQGARAAGLQAARPDYGLSRRHAGRRRDLLEMVTSGAVERRTRR
jgi:hypothetical protein